MKSFRSVLGPVLISLLTLVGPSAIAQQGSVTFPASDVLAKTGDATTSSFKIFNSADVELLRVSANGNVGIGTPTPSQKLEIFNASGISAVVISTPLNASFPVNSSIGGLRLGWKHGGSASNNVDLQVIRGFDAVDGAGLAISTSPNNTQTVERMRITSAGRVGIGSDAPDSRLMVRNAVNGTYAFHARQDSTYTANAAVSDVGGTSEVQTTISAGVTNSETALGQGGLIRHGGAGTLARAYGLMADVIVRPGEAGSMTTAYGVFSGVRKNNGSIGTGFGLYIDDVTATNDYGIWQQGVDDSNYFAGDVIIGPVGAVGNKLVVRGDTNVTGNLTVTGNFSAPNTGSYSVGGTAPAGFPFFVTSSTVLVPAAIQLHSNYANHATSYMGNFGNYGTYLTHNRNPYTGAFTDAAASPNQANAAQISLGDTMPGRNRLFTLSNYPGGTETIRMLVKWNGNVGVGAGVETLMDQKPDKEFVVNGDIEISGNINAKYQDIAEWVPASDDLDPGTVVVLDAALGNGVKASMTAYDTKVAGVVSAQPGITLGESGASKEQVATTGRVRVKVDATRAPIAVGDLLVTSDRPGYAMRSIPVDLAGIAIHRPGTIVGKALEALGSGEGEVLVLLSLQ